MSQNIDKQVSTKNSRDFSQHSYGFETERTFNKLRRSCCYCDIYACQPAKKYQESGQSQLQLRRENQKLKAQIADLKAKLAFADHNQSDFTGIVNKNERLKKILEKSYFALRKEEEDKQRLEKQVYDLRELLSKANTQQAIMEENRDTLHQRIRQLKQNHLAEVQLIWARVADLQTNMQRMAVLIEEDKVQTRQLAKDCSVKRWKGVQTNRQFYY